MDFEAAQIVPAGAGLPVVSAASAFPGWTTTNGVLYNNITLGTPALNVFDLDSPFGVPYQGSYMAGFQYDAFLSQTADVPAFANSINFFTTGPGPRVTLNGVDIPLIDIGGGRRVGDVSTFAGTTAELKFETQESYPELIGFRLDDIVFSPAPVPEPSSFALFALAGCWIAAARRREARCAGV